MNQVSRIQTKPILQTNNVVCWQYSKTFDTTLPRMFEFGRFFFEYRWALLHSPLTWPWTLPIKQVGMRHPPGIEACPAREQRPTSLTFWKWEVVNPQSILFLENFRRLHLNRSPHMQTSLKHWRKNGLQGTPSDIYGTVLVAQLNRLFQKTIIRHYNWLVSEINYFISLTIMLFPFIGRKFDRKK